MTPIELAKEYTVECWAESGPLGTVEWLTISDAALSTFVQRIRDEALTDAEKACEERGKAYRDSRAPGWFEVDHESTQCAAAIRSLKAKP